MDHNSENNISPWKKNAESLLVVYSILAAIGGVILVYQLSDIHTNFWGVTVIPLLLSIFLFIYSGEQITDALDESDVYKLVYLYVPYNLAVILLFWGIVSVIYFRYSFSEPFCLQKQFVGVLGSLATFIIFSLRWFCNLVELLFWPEETFEEYIKELKGGRVIQEHQLPMRLFYRFRKLVSKKSPKLNFSPLLIELKPSNIIGVGVFALKDFAKDEFITDGIHSNDYLDLVPWKLLEPLGDEYKKKVMSFCVGTPEGFFPPPNFDFNQLSVDWYMNHSCDGNVGFDRTGDFVAKRDIRAGDELTYDYGLAESNPKFQLTCSCGQSNCRKIITGNDWKNPKFRELNIRYMLPSLRHI